MRARRGEEMRSFTKSQKTHALHDVIFSFFSSHVMRIETAVFPSPSQCIGFRFCSHTRLFRVCSMNAMAGLAFVMMSYLNDLLHSIQSPSDSLKQLSWL